MGGVINLLVVLALMYVLIKIPFWILGSLRVGGGRSMIGGLARAYVTGRVLGAVVGRGGGRAAGRAAAAVGGGGRGGSGGGSGSGSSVEDPPWPMAPQVYWGTPDGNRRAERARGEIQARRLSEQHRSTPSGTGRGSGVTPPRFQQPAPQTPTHDRVTGHATQAPKPVVFRAARGATSTPSGLPVPPPTPRQRSRAPRRYPPYSAPGAPTARRPVPTPMPPMPASVVASVPPALRFQPATPTPPVTPARASELPAAAVFQPATPDRGAAGRRGYTHTPAPVVFQHPAAHPPATSPPVSRAPLPMPPQPPPVPRTKAQQQTRPPKTRTPQRGRGSS
jgi:hypothetical protein